MQELKLTHEQNLNANKTTARLIDEGKSVFDIEIALAVNELTRRLCQHRGITIKEAKKIVAGFIETKEKRNRCNVVAGEKRHPEPSRSKRSIKRLSGIRFGTFTYHGLPGYLFSLRANEA